MLLSAFPDIHFPMPEGCWYVCSLDIYKIFDLEAETPVTYMSLDHVYK
jgi:hypothetical protein